MGSRGRNPALTALAARFYSIRQLSQEFRHWSRIFRIVNPLRRGAEPSKKLQRTQYLILNPQVRLFDVLAQVIQHLCCW